MSPPRRSPPAPACAVCGTRCRPPFRAPAAELAPDLDGRPGEPARSTLPRWVARCPGCGAAGPDLAALPPTAAATIARADYRAEPDPFLRWSLIAADSGDPAAASEAILQAAWLREDRGEESAPLRRRAAGQWAGDPLRRIDILRRAGAMSEAAALADALASPLAGLDEDGRRILAFQRDRIAAADPARYAISSALRPPARTPHVTHVQKPAPKSATSKPATSKPGLLARLFGRS